MDNLKIELEKIDLATVEAIKAAKSLKELDDIRVKVLGKKGDLTAILKQMGGLSADERPIIGAVANKVRENLENEIKSCETALKSAEINAKLADEWLDVTADLARHEQGKIHPVERVMDELKEIFASLGFSCADGPEIETTYYNFDALNAAPNHPSRSHADTFYFNAERILRSQTSPVQIRVMEATAPPIRIIAPGRVYRRDEIDATHSPVFHQLEGLYVDKNVTMADLKGALQIFVERLFGADAKVRFRPHFFPFTEPSAEMDLMCFSCNGAGCRVCKGEGWIELLGCGMVHPNVLKACNINPDEYSGFAFGMGVDRLVMGRFNIKDMRQLFENDVRFLGQF